MTAPVKKKSQRSDAQNSPVEARVAYPYFHEKRTKNAAGQPYVYGPEHEKAGQPNPRYSVSMMFPKLGPAESCPNYAWLWSLAVEAAKKMWPTNVDAAGAWTWPQGAQYPVRDGDIPYVSKPKPGVTPKTPEQIAAANAWRRGYWIVEMENFLDPGPRIAKIVNGVPTELPARVINDVPQYKSGDWGYPNMHAYAYENKTFGINFGFDGFCFSRAGEVIGATGPRSTQQMFAGLAGTASPAAPVVPGAPIAPTAPVLAAPTAPAAPAQTYAAPGAAPAAPGAAPAPPLPPAAPAAPPVVAAPPVAPVAPPPPMPGVLPAAPPPGLPAFPAPAG